MSQMQTDVPLHPCHIEGGNIAQSQTVIWWFDNRNYYWLYSVKSQLLCVHLKLKHSQYVVICRKAILKVQDQFLSTRRLCIYDETWLQWFLLSTIATWVNIKWVVLIYQQKIVQLKLWHNVWKIQWEIVLHLIHRLQTLPSYSIVMKHGKRALQCTMLDFNSPNLLCINSDWPFS